MTAPSPTMTLADLTEAADVSTRTVRYYIAEGLLPPPEGAGPS
ncbi:MAG: MerR family DNA-binding transcriptional regulator, partial [Chloroflexia bacterium]|nr:MerR family DNA-binding transcriptional regulator [Chloroflexia bacterium]